MGTPACGLLNAAVMLKKNLTTSLVVASCQCQKSDTIPRDLPAYSFFFLSSIPPPSLFVVFIFIFGLSFPLMFCVQQRNGGVEVGGGCVPSLETRWWTSHTPPPLPASTQALTLQRSCRWQNREFDILSLSSRVFISLVERMICPACLISCCLVVVVKESSEPA